MKARKQRVRFWSAVGCLIAAWFLVHNPAQSDVLAGEREGEIEIAIDVAPNVLNLQSRGQWVTVHTDIAFSVVDDATVFLNGAKIDWWKSDNQGNFVAKFVIAEIKALEELIIGDYNTLTLEGSTTEGACFFGEQDILVVNNLPQGR